MATHISLSPAGSHERAELQHRVQDRRDGGRDNVPVALRIAQPQAPHGVQVRGVRGPHVVKAARRL